MTTLQRRECHAAIHTASAACAAIGAGLAQVPCSDSLLITPIQLAMSIALAKVFDLELDDGVHKAGIASASATIVGRAASQIFIGWFPLLGNVINALTAASLTETIGWIIADEFDKLSGSYETE